MGLGGRFQGLSQLYLEYSSLGATNPIVPFVPVVFGSSIISGQFAKLIKSPQKLPSPCWDLLFISQAALPQAAAALKSHLSPFSSQGVHSPIVPRVSREPLIR